MPLTLVIVGQELQGDVGNSKERISKLHEMLDSIVEQLGDARVDKHEDSRRKKRQEIVENFKQLYSGVYDRMINMCQPIHKRWVEGKRCLMLGYASSYVGSNSCLPCI